MEELALMTAIIRSNPGINIESAWKQYRELVTRVHTLNSQLKINKPVASPEPACDLGIYMIDDVTNLVLRSNPRFPDVGANSYKGLLKTFGYQDDQIPELVNSFLKKKRQAQKALRANSGQASLTMGYTKRNLKVKPQDAIKKDTIACCICGKSMTSINARHLASHNGLTKEGYLKLCGYPVDQVLMSLNHLAKMKTQVLKAQKAREKKQKESGKAPVKVRKGKKEAAAS